MKIIDSSIHSIMQTVWKKGMVIAGFNIPHLPMMEPVIRALTETETFGLIMVARLEWMKFRAGSMQDICNEYQKLKDENFTRLHLDHVPVIDEDNLLVDYERTIADAIEMGYNSVMVDGSRLTLDQNIKSTAKVVKMAHAAGVPVESELGAVLGHEEGPLPPYEELFKSAKGFTSPEEARRFVEETETDWLSVAIGNIHGAISETAKGQKKPAARLSISHLQKINELTRIPLVLHGGSGIKKEPLMEAFQNGIAKINIGTSIRQPYERMMENSVKKAQDAVYHEMLDVIENQLEIKGNTRLLNTL